MVQKGRVCKARSRKRARCKATVKRYCGHDIYHQRLWLCRSPGNTTPLTLKFTRLFRHARDVSAYACLRDPISSNFFANSSHSIYRLDLYTNKTMIERNRSRLGLQRAKRGANRSVGWVFLRVAMERRGGGEALSLQQRDVIRVHA